MEQGQPVAVTTSKAPLVPAFAPSVALSVTPAPVEETLIGPLQEPPLKGPALVGVTVPVEALSVGVPVYPGTRFPATSRAEIKIVNGVPGNFGLPRAENEKWSKMGSVTVTVALALIPPRVAMTVSA
jgi:hypothetical protein